MYMYTVHVHVLYSCIYLLHTQHFCIRSHEQVTVVAGTTDDINPSLPGDTWQLVCILQHTFNTHISQSLAMMGIPDSGKFGDQGRFADKMYLAILLPMTTPTCVLYRVRSKVSYIGGTKQNCQFAKFKTPPNIHGTALVFLIYLYIIHAH